MQMEVDDVNHMFFSYWVHVHLCYFAGTENDETTFPSAPLEILARGPEAFKAYNEAVKTGEKKIYRTRLMLVGQERVGKTSLKKTLTGKE